jgi:uncharacterized damage-inducible protein DinB
MTPLDELDTFRSVWDAEAEQTIRLLEALPNDQYDFRPDPQGRSIGELAWHLSEIDACLSFGIAAQRFRLEDEPPNLKRGQLVLMCRMAGGAAPGLYGPNREEMQAIRTQMESAKP